MQFIAKMQQAAAKNCTTIGLKLKITGKPAKMQRFLIWHDLCFIYKQIENPRRKWKWITTRLLMNLSLLITDSLQTVSYTHLDVYKRQV